jgi:hypothetical protein
VISDWISRKHERSVDGFISLLSPASGVLASDDDDAQDFIYRGHSSEKYDLVPNVFRGRGAPFPWRGPHGKRTYGEQIRAEIAQLYEFYKLADERGLHVPEYSHRLKQVLEECNDPEFIDNVSVGKAAWPSDELLSLLALAQHYGVPTRLLDFTRSPYVAAYFAAEGASQFPHRGNLAVWAVNKFPFEDDSQWDWLQHRIRIVTAPGSDIPNLLAQQGLFLLSQHPIQRDDSARPGGKKVRNFRTSDSFKAESYERIMVNQLIAGTYEQPLLFKFTVPAKLAPELLAVLAKLGIDGSSIYPGYAGVARALRERLFLPAGSSSSTRHARSSYAPMFKRWRKQVKAASRAER